MIEQLFGSKTRVKLLQLFFANPNRNFYVREITRKIDEQINSVRRELANLLSIGIIVSEDTNNKLFYEVNQNYEFYAPLSAIFGGQSGAFGMAGGSIKPARKQAALNDMAGAEEGVEGPVADAGPAGPAVGGKPVMGPNDFSDQARVKALGNVEVALYTGQFTRDELSGIDVFFVGDLNQTKLQKFMAELEAKEGKDLRYTVMSLNDFHYRQQIKDRFVSNILLAKKQVLVDKHNSLK
jgi:hypothetical protein